jgi:glycine/serine hydroxymethyltransferase
LIGTPALTSRGFKEEHMITIAAILDKVVKLCVEVQEKTGILFFWEENIFHQF